jgi:type VI secretion system protein ImpI
VRVVVDGTVDILRARNQIRREFRLPVTQAERDRNNPLKFSMNAEDALHNILVKRNPAFLAALPAFEEAFDDLRSHQMAMLKGLRVAYEHMLTRFDPRQLESRFESTTKNNTFKGLAGRPKTWEQYTAWYEEQTEDANECFRRMFGEQFAKAYEQELQALARNRRKNRTGE